MKILIFSDCHWSTNSSIVRSRGQKFSTRLEFLISSMNWLNELAVKENCSEMICAGDFMDKSILNDEEITALQNIYWNDLPCIFLCGNHESSVADLRYSSIKAVESKSRLIVSDSGYNQICDDTQIHFLPYILETEKQELKTYLNKNNSCVKHIIISHNDIAGINYGGFESTLGFSINEIEENCDLFLNGHLHNSEWITDKILNVGSFSGHNFTNDSNRYKYGVWILDTDSLKVDFYENPYSLNFYKLDIKTNEAFIQLNNIKQNAVLSIKTNKDVLLEIKNLIQELGDKVIESRVVIEQNFEADSADVSIEDLQGTDHIQRLIQFCREKIINNDILESELAEICK